MNKGDATGGTSGGVLNGSGGHGMTDEQMLTPGQLARATAALDAWYANPGGSDYRAPGVTWAQSELENMHAALEAPTLDAALAAFGVEPDSWLSTPEQDAENRALMTAVRERLGRS